MPDNETLLEEIRERFDDYLREWQDIREAGDLDMRMIADGPWPEEERKARADIDNPRPCESFDELGQYLNQAIGDMRQNKRAVKVTPTGNGANDVTAEKRAGMIRQIEYDSNAQTAYQTACENMFKRSYGYIKLGSRYEDPARGFDCELYVGTVPNPNTILVDPYAKEPDWSDMAGAFEFETYSEKEFMKKWPDAEIHSFGAEEMELAPAWIKGDRIQVASYWQLKKTERRQVQIDIGEGPVDVFLDELPGAKVKGDQLILGSGSVKVLKDRQTEEPVVTQYVTNGLEILETKPQKWIEIPIIPLFGPEEWVDDGGGSKRRLLSMVRKARGAYLGYCYARNGELEALGRAPKIPYGGYEGQFNTQTPWDKINKVSLTYFEVKAKTTATGDALLPIPVRQDYDPPIQSYEMAAASFKLAIQTAMGVSGLANGNRSQNQDAKSGKAIEALDRQENQGTFVYVSNYERGLERCGRMLEQGLTWCYDTPREVGSRAPDDTYSSEKINQPVQDAQGQTTQFNTADGDHGTTISVGPSEQSDRDAVDDFIETLFTIPNLPPKIYALAVRLRHLGPIGDEIAEAFDPKGPDPKAAAQQVQVLQTELAKTQGFAQKLHEEAERETAKLANQLEIARMQEETKRTIGLAAIDVKDAQTKFMEELGIVHKKMDQSHALTLQLAKHLQAKDLQAGAQAHEASEAAKAQGADRQSQDSAQTHQAEQATQAQGAAAESQESAQEADAAARPEA